MKIGQYEDYKNIPEMTKAQAEAISVRQAQKMLRDWGFKGYSNALKAELTKALMEAHEKARKDQEQYTTTTTTTTTTRQKTMEELLKEMGGGDDDSPVPDDVDDDAWGDASEFYDEPDEGISDETYQNWGAKKDGKGFMIVEGYKNKIPEELYFDSEAFYTFKQYKAFTDDEFNDQAEIVADIVLGFAGKNKPLIDYQVPAVTELLAQLFTQSNNRRALAEGESPGTEKAKDALKTFNRIEAAINKISRMPKDPPAKHQDSQMKSQVEIPNLDDKKKQLQKVVDEAMRLGPIDTQYYSAANWEAFLNDAPQSLIDKEVKEIDDALNILLDAQQDKWETAEFINTQRLKLNQLRNHLTKPMDYAGGKQPTSDDFVAAATDKNKPPAGISAVPVGTGQTYSVRKGPQQPDYVDTTPDYGANVGEPVPRAPPQPNLGRAPSQPPRVFGAPVSPAPVRAPPANPAAPPPENLKQEAREYIRKIGEIPITELPANLNDIKNSLQQGLREQAGKAIDDALEETKKIEAEKKEKESKKTPLEDLRPDIEKGEARRIRKDFNRDVLELTTANEVLQSQVELQKEEIKTLKESIESKKKRENDAMLSGIAPVFRHFLNLEIDNVVEEEKEQVYYTVI
jgi:hypothetical protein